ncbi:helicase-related protein [Flavitalea flava]
MPMKEYLNNPRLIFRDTVQKCLIGPGSDVFGLDASSEIISDYPLKRYYSAVLFPSSVNKGNDLSIGGEDDTTSKTEYSDSDNNDPGADLSESNSIDGAEDPNYKKKKISTNENEGAAYSETNHYFPTNFGLTFCVEENTNAIQADFSFSRYHQITNPTDARIEVSLDDFNKLVNNDTFPLVEYLAYEDGKMYFKTTGSEIENTGLEKLTVYNLNKHFKDNPEIRNSSALHKAELLLGRTWRREQIPTISLNINLNDTASDNYKGVRIFGDESTANTVTCYYKRVYQTKYGKYVKILMENGATQPKRNFSTTNEKLNGKCIFQVQIKVTGTQFKPYKPLFENNPYDDELNTINYQYRNEYSFAIGHGCAVTWNNTKKPTELVTTFLPEVDIKNYSNDFRKDFPENVKSITIVKQLSIWTEYSKEQIISKLKLFVGEYLKWIDSQKGNIPTKQEHIPIFESIIANQQKTYDRLLKNINYLNNNDVAYSSFLLANTAMFIQMVISKDAAFGKKAKELVDFAEYNVVDYDSLEYFEKYVAYNPSYYPFQLAFLLLNIESTINEDSPDRNDIVDLLWFPTGGGKTEAYLALTAFTIFCRRRLNKENANGVSVIMRYTLRLLTAQQFERASKLILAIDFLRKKFQNGDIFSIGTFPITIGMWVGSATTPNTYNDAKHIVTEIQNSLTFINQGKYSDYKRKNTFPVTNCPWCGCNLISKKPETNFLIQGYKAQYSASSRIGSFTTHCLNVRCSFHNELPIYFVDDAIYEKQPDLLFATVDKFAMLSHRKEGNLLFNSLSKNGLPPDLIIQDELHLLSGPLGSITGLFEAMVEMLCTKGKRKPKIIASTATTRNTSYQIEMLYGSRKLNVFPSPGTTYDDNFFSYVSVNSKRKHIGFIPTGKTALDTQIQVIAHLLLARIELYRLLVHHTSGLSKNDAIGIQDFYWTIVSFYNSLKDVGKIYNKIPAEILTLLKLLHNRFGIAPVWFGFNHYGLAGRTKELTSRIESYFIKSLLSELEQPFGLTDKENETNYVTKTVDLVLASNMFSVGIDIKRLNIMLMNGQPRNVAEYIQASSRVGRDKEGIVFNLLDPNRSREKSYFENYVPFNNAYYKFVEPLSITPYTEITLDKALNSILICYVRHKKGYFEDKDAKDFDGNIDELKVFLSLRIKNKSQLSYALNKLDILNEEWQQKRQELDLKYKGAENENHNLIQKSTNLDDWSLMQSMREIDTNSLIKIFIN